jgi:dipeptidase E
MDFAETPGKVVAGLSAGAILLTPSINTASFPTFDCDDNFVKLKNLKSLGLINYEFFPHYRNSERYRRALANYTKKSPYPLLGSPDLGGLVINENETRIVGSAQVFYKGRTFRMDRSTGQRLTP